jgi:hypothetical protein
VLHRRRPWRRRTALFVVLAFEHGYEPEEQTDSEQIANAIAAVSGQTHRELLINQTVVTANAVPLLVLECSPGKSTPQN